MSKGEIITEILEHSTNVRCLNEDNLSRMTPSELENYLGLCDISEYEKPIGGYMGERNSCYF